MPDRLPPRSRPFRARTAVLVVLSLLAGLVGVPLVLPTPPAAAAPSAASRWTFDEGSGTTAADSVGTKPVTLTSGTTWGPGIQGASALVTNGSSNGAATSGPVLTTSSSYTVSAWAKLNNTSGYQTVVSQDGTQVSGFYLGLQGNTGRWSFVRLASDSNGGTKSVATATTGPTVGQWYHLVGIYDATASTISLYVNGRLQQTVATGTPPWNATGPLAIGRARYDSGSVDRFNGSIDDVSVYPSVLSATDIEQLTEAARWKFEEGAGTTAADDSANGYTGTLTNGPTWTAGEIGSKAVLFDGSDDSVSTTSSVVDTSKSFSVSAWARADTAPGVATTVASVDGTNASAFALQRVDAGTWGFSRSSADVASPTFTTALSTATAVSGTWYHLVGVYDSVGQTLTLYVNGVKQPTVSGAAGWKGTGTFVIGRGRTGGNPSTFFTGAVDDVRAYSYVLDDAAVTALAGPVPTAPATPSATAGTSSATLTWAAPADNGGSNLTGYLVTPYRDGTAQTPVTYDASTTTRTLTGLTPGSSYRFTVAAVNPIGPSPASPQSSAVTPYNVPSAPAITAVTAGDQRVTLTWTAPSNGGGSAIAGYTVTPYIGSTAQPATTFASAALTQTVTGLTAGTAYTFTVAAQNAVGTGPPSAASSSVTPNASPTLTFAAPPGGLVGTPYSTQLTVTGGTAPFSWSVTSGTLPPGITLSAGGLLSGTPTTAGTSTFTVQVTDANAQSDVRSVTLTVTSAAPAAPATPTATAGVTAATVSWTAPASNGSPITGYVVTPYLAGVAQAAVSYDASTTSRTLTGLTAGGSYTFTVAAVNANGTGPASAPSAAVTPYNVPAAPTITNATAGDLRVTLTWTAPAANGSAISGYLVTPFIGSTAQTSQLFAGAATTQTVTGLTAGTAYTFTVAAQNAAGTGPASAASSSVTPNANPTLTFAAPPPAAVGTAYSTQLVVTGGTAPFTWTVTTGTLPPGITLSAGGLLSGTPTTVGSSTFTVQVSDANARTATRSVTLVVSDRPGAPPTPTATAGLTSAVLTWTAPASNGSPITSYVITPTANGTVQAAITVDPAAKTRTLNGLTAGAIYSFTVAAVNANGTSAASPASNLVTPYAALSAPTVTSVTAGSTSATLSWTAPTSTGGSPVTGYVVTPYIGSTAQPAQTFASTATTQTVTGLTAGTAYTFKVAALNSSGVSWLYRNNVGGPALASGDAGPGWSADTTGATRSNGAGTSTWNIPVVVDSTVPSTTPPGIFTTQRYDTGTRGDGQEMKLAYPVATGTPVLVRVYFDNGNSPWAAGQRVFDMALEGTTVMDGFDPVVAAGGNQRGTMREFAVTSDGTINLDFLHNPTDPILNGVEIIQTGVATTGPPSAASSSVTPNASPTLTFAPPPAATVGVAYSTQLTVTGGTAPFVWSVASGTLPAGITLSSGGLLSGTPTTVGTSAFTVQVTDASGQVATKAVNLAVRDRPEAPAAPTATAGASSATVSWVAPTTNGSAITGYVVTPYLGGSAQTPVSFDASTTTRTLSGLTAGGVYTFTVAAVNAVGPSAASPESNPVVPYTVPSAPAITAATAGDLSVTLTWSTPTANGSPVTGYVVTPFIGGVAQPTVTFASTATTQTVSGLTAGTAYTFTVAAQNAAGTGPPSAASASVTPNANPTLTFGNPPLASVGVAYSNQFAVNGGTAPFTWSVSGGTLPAGLTLSAGGLLGGTPTAVGSAAVTIRVVDASGQVATRATTVAVADRPAAPATPTATAGLTSAVLTWVAPATNNSPITGYVITPTLNGVAQGTITVDPSAKTRTLNGLTPGGVYSFTVAAVNAAGTSSPSAASNLVTPYAALNAPTITSATAGSTSVTLSWSAPTSTGGSPVTGYVVTPYIGSTAQPPQTFTAPLRALWWDTRGDWDRAHAIVAPHESDRAAAWVHAYLHRREGDAFNAGYWYRRAGRPASTLALDDERAAIIDSLLAETAP